MKNDWQRFTSPSMGFPLRFRGILLFVLSLYLLFSPARLKSDIVAAGFAISSLAILFLFCAVSIRYRRKLARQLKLEFSSRANKFDEDPEQRVFAGDEVVLVSKIYGLRVAPFFELRLSYQFEQAQIGTKTHCFGSSSAEQKIITEAVNFPHRGKWKLLGMSAEFVDRLGLTSIRLPFLTLNEEIVVHPLPYACPRWPVIASTSRVDDQIHHPLERRGDMYDLKQYHPSDGTRRILWKMFAKSGQLFSRQPEQAYSPEGKIVFMSLARRLDDKLASESLAYLEELERLEIEIMFSTLSTVKEIATTATTARTLLIEQVWNSERADSDSLKSSLMTLIARAKGNNNERSLQTVVIAVSESSLGDSNYRNLVEECKRLLDSCELRTSIFASSSPLTIFTAQSQSRTQNKLGRLFLEPNELDLRSAADTSKGKDYISNLASNSAEVSWS